MNRPRIALNQGRIAFKPAVNLHPWFVSARSQFLLFGKHPEQAADVSSFHELHIVKDRPSVRLGGLIAALFYRFLFAIASRKARGWDYRGAKQNAAQVSPPFWSG